MHAVTALSFQADGQKLLVGTESGAVFINLLSVALLLGWKDARKQKYTFSSSQASRQYFKSSLVKL